MSAQPPTGNQPSYAPEQPNRPAPPAEGAWARLRQRLGLSNALLVALFAAVGGFVLSLSFTSSSTHNGVLTSCTYVDAGPLLLAPVAAVAGLVAVARCRRPGRRALLEVGVGLLCVAVAALHVFRGLGVLGGPC